MSKYFLYSLVKNCHFRCQQPKVALCLVSSPSLDLMLRTTCDVPLSGEVIIKLQPFAIWFRTAWKWDIKITLSYELGSEWVSEWANKWAQRSARAVGSKQTSEQCDQTSKWTSDWPNTYVPISGCSKPPCSEDIHKWVLHSGIDHATNIACLIIHQWGHLNNLQRFRASSNQDISDRPLAHLLAPPTRLLAPHY